MKPKFLILLAFIFVITTVGIKTASQIASQSGQLKALEDKEKRDSLTIKERVELAKARGQKEVHASGIVTLQPIAQSPEEINQLLPRYTVVLAEVVEQFGHLSDPRTILSWNKFKVIDVLSQAPPQQTFAVRETPAQLLPIKEGEFLVPTSGGAATLDGIEVIQSDQSIPRFKKQTRYLLLLSLDPSTRIAELALGPQSVLPVNGDNSLNKHTAPHMLQEAIRRFHNNSLDQLKRNIHK